MIYKQTTSTRRASAEKRRRIIDAAYTLVARGGFQEASIRSTAEGAGISTGSVYSYFGNRDELLAELFRELAAHEFAAVEEAVRGASPGLESSLAALIETFADRALKAPVTAEALLFEPASPLVEAERLKFRGRYHRLIVEVIDDGILNGAIPPQNSGVSARAITGAISEALMGRLSPTAPAENHEDIKNTLIIFCTRALGVTQ